MGDAIDEYLGGRLRELRKRTNLSQKDVAAHLDLSYQQVQQYENGNSRLPASVVFRLSQLFNTTPGYFYEGVDLALLPQMQINSINAVRQSPLNILLIEDNAADEALIREILEPLDVKVQVSRSGNDATKLLNQFNEIGEPNRPELILLDLTLPQESGIDLLLKLKRSRQHQDIAVVVLTNSIHSDDVLRAYRNGASGFFKKTPLLSDMEPQMRKLVEYWKTIIMPSMQFVNL